MSKELNDNELQNSIREKFEKTLEIDKYFSVGLMLNLEKTSNENSCSDVYRTVVEVFVTIPKN